MNPAVLDDPEERRRLDPGGMLQSVAGLPEQCREAWAAAQALELPHEYADPYQVVVAGMGGSAIAGDLWRVLIQRETPIPIHNVRQYDLPPFVDERTLVIASSLSMVSTPRAAAAIMAASSLTGMNAPLMPPTKVEAIAPPFFTQSLSSARAAVLPWAPTTAIPIA